MELYITLNQKSQAVLNALHRTTTKLVRTEPGFLSNKPHF